MARLKFAVGRRNLRQLLESAPDATFAATALGISRGYLYQLCADPDRRGSREVTAALLAKLERAIGLAEGALQDESFQPTAEWWTLKPQSNRLTLSRLQRTVRQELTEVMRDGRFTDDDCFDLLKLLHSKRR